MKRISNDIKRLKPKGGGGSIFLQMQSRIYPLRQNQA